MRKLATIQQITNIRPIPGADKIEVADVLGWSVVVGKDEFKVGDLAVYFEIDSWLDASNPAFASFEERFTNWGDKRGMRLKTIKLRKQISQGLLMPVDKFPGILCGPHSGFALGSLPVLEEGMDVTDLLKIEKWEAAEEAVSNGPNKVAGKATFPSFIRKTDQERVQNYISELGKHSDETFEISIKLDGSSMTVFHVGKDSPHYQYAVEDMAARAAKRLTGWKKLVHKVREFFGMESTFQAPLFLAGVCSRNIELPLEDSNQFSNYVRDTGLVSRLVAYGKNIAVQGELVGPGIPGNYEKMGANEFFVYDVFDIDKQEYLLPADVQIVCLHLGLKSVPVLETQARLFDFEHEADDGSPDFHRALVDNILKHAEGPGMNPGVKREGVVWKSNSTGFSFKAISNSYLLHKEGK